MDLMWTKRKLPTKNNLKCVRIQIMFYLTMWMSMCMWVCVMVFFFKCIIYWLHFDVSTSNFNLRYSNLSLCVFPSLIDSNDNIELFLRRASKSLFIRYDLFCLRLLYILFQFTNLLSFSLILWRMQNWNINSLLAYSLWYSFAIVILLRQKCYFEINQYCNAP